MSCVKYECQDDGTMLVEKVDTVYIKIDNVEYVDNHNNFCDLKKGKTVILKLKFSDYDKVLYKKHIDMFKDELENPIFFLCFYLSSYNLYVRNYKTIKIYCGNDNTNMNDVDSCGRSYLSFLCASRYWFTCLKSLVIFFSNEDTTFFHDMAIFIKENEDVFSEYDMCTFFKEINKFKINYEKKDKNGKKFYELLPISMRDTVEKIIKNNAQ